MRVAVEFQDERLELEVSEASLIGEWHGPSGFSPSEARARVVAALESPRHFPPLRQAVVPGDKVVIAFDPEIPEGRAVLDAACRVLREAGVEQDSITVLAPAEGADALARLVPDGVRPIVHDPDDRTQLAYLATTAGGRRVYLSRHLTDADLVIPVGRLGYDPVLGYGGPWGVIFPGLSDRETARAFRALASDVTPDLARPTPALVESAEVSWLLGCQIQVGIVSGIAGVAEAIAGLELVVREEGARALDRSWGFEVESRAELVIAGIGGPGGASGLGALAEGLATATRLVRRGGKIVALSRVGGPIGPASRRLIAVDDPRVGPEALKGHETDPDYPAARQLARALAWADVYVLSALDRDDVDGLSMIPLDRPEEARRLAAQSVSCIVVAHAERTRARVADEADGREDPP